MKSPRLAQNPTTDVGRQDWATCAPFTHHDAHERGLTDKALMALCRDGQLRRPLRGAYVGAAWPDTLALRSQILCLVVPSDCFVADQTAAWLHGADSALSPNDHLEIPPVSVFRRPGAGRLRNGLAASGERRVLPRDLAIADGLPVTTPLRTALDLGRLQRRDIALAGMDGLARLSGIGVAQIVRELPRFAKMRGVVQLRALAPLVDGLAQSAGESALRLRWLDAGLPQPQLQVPVRRPDGRYFYLDLGLRAHRFAAEYDGLAWHTSPSQRRNDRARRAWLRDVAGWTIVVLTREEVYAQQTAIGLLAEAWRKHRRHCLPSPG